MPILTRARKPLCTFVRNVHQTTKNINIGVLDVPFEKGQKKTGVSKGPKAMRDANLIKELLGLPQVKVKDYGEVQYKIPEQSRTVSNMNNYEHVVSCNKNLAATVECIINEGNICLTLGGDHSISLGTVSGHSKAKKNISVLWIDAHADINTNRTSGSGSIHGMPMAMIAKEVTDYWEKLPGMDWHQPSLSLSNVAYIGLRSVDPYEKWLLNKFGVVAYDMFDVQKLGIDSIVSLALSKIDPHNDRSLHLSFDIDSLDPREAPSTGTPVPGGLLLREGMYVAHTVHNTGRLGAMDLVEVNPQVGSQADVEKTVQSALQVILAAFGHNRKGTEPNLPALSVVSK